MDENTDIKLTVGAWADIVEKIWLDKIGKLRLRYSGQLEESFKHEVITNAAGNVERIEFAFNYYGKFVDMGVGRGVKIGDVNEQSISRRLEGRGSGNRRAPKPWYSKTIFAERMKLAEILAKKYAHKGSIVIVENMDDNAESWNSSTL